ncbi:MAG: hypothetical protein ABGY41_15945, partial [Candidatus Poribacteria bacterium]
MRLSNESQHNLLNARVSLSADDADVTVVKGEVNHGPWLRGEKRTNSGFILDIAPDATPHDISVVVDVTSDNGGPRQFTYTLPIVLPAAGLAARSFWARDKVTGDADGDANPGERVEIKARLKNESATDFLNVVATLSSSDDVVIVNGTVNQATWPAGVARNNDGLLVDIGADASGTVGFTLDVTADNGGPWQFTYTLPVVPLPTGLAARSFWARDKVTGNADGNANAGER